MYEATIMSKIDHEHVLKLYGVCIADFTVKLITPFRKLGSLDVFLRKYKEELSPEIQLKFCQQIASVRKILSQMRLTREASQVSELSFLKSVPKDSTYLAS